MPTQHVYGCPVDVPVSVVGGKWKLVILFYLLQQPRRTGELRNEPGSAICSRRSATGASTGPAGPAPESSPSSAAPANPSRRRSPARAVRPGPGLLGRMSPSHHLTRKYIVGCHQAFG